MSALAIGDRVRLTNDAGSETGTVVARLLMNRVRVSLADGQTFVVPAVKLTKVVA